jgi:hypothetical protein
MDVPVTARIAGRRWRTSLDFNEAPVLMRHLGTAAFGHAHGGNPGPAHRMLPRSYSRLGRQAGTASDPAATNTRPIGDRLRANAARLREQADEHERTRITITGTDTP